MNGIWISPGWPALSKGLYLCRCSNHAGRSWWRKGSDLAPQLHTLPTARIGLMTTQLTSHRLWPTLPDFTGTLEHRAVGYTLGPPGHNTLPDGSPTAPTHPGCGFCPWSSVQSKFLGSKTPGFISYVHHHSICMISKMFMHFPGSSVVRNPPGSTGDPDSIPGWGMSPGGGHGNTLQYSCLENPMDRRACQVIVHGVAESNMTEPLSMYIQTRS